MSLEECAYLRGSSHTLLSIQEENTTIYESNVQLKVYEIDLVITMANEITMTKFPITVREEPEKNVKLQNVMQEKNCTWRNWSFGFKCHHDIKLLY